MVINKLSNLKRCSAHYPCPRYISNNQIQPNTRSMPNANQLNKKSYPKRITCGM